MDLKPLDDLAADLDLATRQKAAALANVSPPDQILADLHVIPFSTGDDVRDTVTGQSGVVVGFGVEQVAVTE